MAAHLFNCTDMQHYMVAEVEWQMALMTHGPPSHLITDAAVMSAMLGGFKCYLHERQHVRQDELLSVRGYQDSGFGVVDHHVED